MLLQTALIPKMGQRASIDLDEGFSKAAGRNSYAREYACARMAL